MLKNSTYGESGGSHCFQGGVSGWPEGICEALVFQGKATPASKSAGYEPKPEWLSPPSSPSRRFHHRLKKIPFSLILPPAQKKQRPRGTFMRLTGTLQNVVSKARRPLRRVRGPWRCTRRPFPAREKPQADSFSAAAGVFLPAPVDSISAKRSSSSRMRRSISAICCTMVRFFSLSRETMQVR